MVYIYGIYFIYIHQPSSTYVCHTHCYNLTPPGMVIPTPTSTAQKATEYTATSLVCGRIYKALGEPRG